MKPEQFIRDFGEKKAREVVEGAPKYAQRYRAGMYLKQGEWTWFWSETSGKWLQYEKHIYSTSHFDFAVDLSDLKRLVGSLERINKCGGLYGFKTYCNGDYSQEDLRAIRDHESIYGGGE
ncbi:hypothetical protein [Acinetobacter baumannii]|uniref:hypothetical protein n=1 Tax=Acinetobacter baumannii TaxID=470 RepID=UPI0004612843|nr:hypothetical protein [Acinetobacter baumannii]KCY22505.1 hypothetical protein J635_1954 [Acinetobacter baumannii 233846]